MGRRDQRPWHRLGLRYGTDGHPYGGRPALRRLIEAAGGYDVDLP
ncbi:hypothetical protein [Actinacidiphila paucisporea]|nr:hypothetical protein [Actinacidiphila paucisporea]